jgi:DNA-binding transcriptional LysR family regulator
MQRVDLGDLDAFAAVAQHRSFRRAAAARGVSPSTLSQTIKDLEARLGVRLLNRTTRSVAPTEAGAKLLERLSPSLADIAAAVDDLQGEDGAPAGTVRINAPTPAVELVLAPIVAEFLKAHPKVRLEVVTEGRLIDIVKEGYDAGVRWGESLAQDMIAVPLGPPQRFVVSAAPELLAIHGVPAAPHDLMRYPCIRQRFLSGVTPAWEFERGDEIVRLDPPARLISTNIALQRRAVIAGVGVWATFEDYVADDLADGRLCRLLDEWCPSFPGPFLYHPSRRHVPAALRAFIDFARKGI